MSKKYPKVTITKEQYNFINELLQKECIAVAEQKACINIYGKPIAELKNAYMSSEYNTIQYIVRAIAGNYLNRLNILEV